MPNPGDLVGGKYRIVRLIGDGGMGTVYEARHEILGSAVALKFLHADLASRQGLVARFMQEARVSATIQSPHVTRVSDVDQEQDGSAYLVMDLLGGESLQERLDRDAPLARDEAIDIALQMLAGLEAAHAVGVVHRDLKPDNVFITPSGGGPIVKLLDFGIAKLRQTSEYKQSLTRPGAIMGTPEYMAPEQAFAADQVDARADLYSWGVILYEMLTGKRPVESDEPTTIVESVIRGQVTRLAERDASLPPGLVQLVDRTISANPDQRPQSARELRLELARFAGALSYAGKFAASNAVEMSSRPATQIADSGDRSSGVPKTLPPDDTPPASHSSTGTEPGHPATEPGRPSTESMPVLPGATGMSAVHPGTLQQHAYSAPPPVVRRRSKRGLWVMLAVVVLGLGGLGAVVVLDLLAFPSAAPPPALPQPAPLPMTTITAQGGKSEPPAPREAPEPDPPSQSRRSASKGKSGGRQPAPPPARSPGDAGAQRVPGLPFPPFQIPSALPPGFPTSLPTSIPTELPRIPGFPGPNPPPAPSDQPAAPPDTEGSRHL